MKYIIVLLFSIGLSAQTFDFECITYTTVEDYSHITLDTPAWDYFKLFSDDLYRSTGIDYRNELDVPIKDSITTEFSNLKNIVTFTSFSINNIYAQDGVVFSFTNNINYAGRSGEGCNDDKVWILINKNAWDNNFTVLQRLWAMYHELGHDVLNYDHNRNDRDILEVGKRIPVSLETLEQFIISKNRMFDDISQIHYNCN